jgi:hypothetical protein
MRVRWVRRIVASSVNLIQLASLRNDWVLDGETFMEITETGKPWPDIHAVQE